MQKRLYILLQFVIALAIGNIARSQIINTISGTPVAGLSGDGGPAYLARLFYPTSVALDAAGNLFISDAANRRIRKINTSGIISTVVGSGCGFACYGYGGDGGPATAAVLYYPNVIILDTFGNMFLADYGNYRIRKVNTAGIISTYAGNGMSSGYSPDGVPATSVNINFTNMALDGAGNIYFGTGYRIRKVNTAGIISAYAGAGTVGFSGDGGPATDAALNGNGNVVADAAGNLYIADNLNYRVRKVNTAGIITTVAGNGSPGNSGDGGPATNASMIPFYVSLDKIGNLYITDSANECIRRVDVFGTITTIAGTGVAGFSGDGGPATLAKLYKPGGVAADNAGNIYIADGTNNRIRKISYGNHPPHFINGHSQSITVCEYSAFDPLNTLLSVTDTDISQSETWSVITPPVHGTAFASYLTASTGSAITPVGTYYTPVTGYTGPDSFKIKITDGLQSDSTTIHVMVNASPGIITGPGSTCTGMFMTLSDTTGTGTWSSSNPAVATIGSLSGTVSGITAGIATITYTPSVGCINTKTITVNSVPSPVSGPAGVCTGSTATFNDSISGGTWTSSSLGIATVNPASGIAAGISAGLDTIIYTMSPGCYTSIVTSVYPLPAAISGPSHVCPGATITLGDVTPGGVWFSSSTGIASIGLSSGIVTGIMGGASTISYSVTTLITCSITKNVTVDPAPGSISGTLQLCPGGSTALTDSGGGTWNSSVPAIATIGSSTGLVSALSPGYTTITYSLSTGCITSAYFTVNSMPAAIAGAGVVCQGATTPLTDAGGGAWSSSNTSIATVGSAGLLTGISAGTAVITYTLSTGCSVTMPVTVALLPAVISGPSSVCVASTITLSDSLTGGTWSSSMPSAATVNTLSGVVSGVSAGSTDITYTSGMGCTVFTTIYISPLPPLFTVTGGGTYCAGGTGFHVGLGSSGHAYNYQLVISGVPGITLPGGSGTPIDFGLQTTAGIYTVVSTNIGTGCSRLMTGSATIIVNPLPALISGPSAVCIGSSVTEVSGSGGAWSSSAPSIASIGSSSGIVSGLLFGTANITYTLPTTCFTSATITVSTTPAAITGASTVCVGSAIPLSDSIAGGSWTSSNTAVATVGSLSGMVTGITNGIVTITYSLGSGCTKTKSVTVNPLPAGITGVMGICTGHLTSLSDATPGGSWSSGSPGVAGVGTATGIVSGLIAGTAAISYTSAAGCSSVSVVTVNAAPSPIAGSLHACTGQTDTLTDPAGGGSWTITPATIATIGSATGVVTGIAAGNANVTYSLGSGCTVSAIVTVSITPAAITGTASVCAASLITLSETTTGGTWGSSNTTIATVSGTGIVSGVSAGNVIISYTVSGCAATMPVTVNPLPVAITGVSNLCAGSTATLNDVTAGGTWSSSLPGIASIGSSSGFINGIAAGTATITYTLITGCRTTKGITVNALPAAITGGTTLCIGSVITLSDATVGGTWVPGPGGAVSLGTSGIVTGLSLGTAVISYVVSGCTAVTTLTVSPLPPGITGPNHVCSGSTITLTDAGIGTWSSGTPATVSVGSATGIVTGGSAGVGIISYSLGPGCTVATTVTVIALPSAISGPSSVCTGASVTLTDIASGGAWSSASPSIATVGTSGIVNGVSGGTAIISYTVSTGCAATHSITSITVPDILSVHNICAWGDTMIISDSITTGLYTSSLATVTNLGGGICRVAGNAPGLASVSYIIPAGCSVSKQFTVNPLPNMISGATLLCTGDSITLTDASPGGTWSSSGTGILTAGSASGVVTGITGGTAFVIYTLSATGCRADTAITVTNLPVAGIITGPDSLCAGTTITLADTIAGGAWSSSGILTTVSGGLVNGLLAGTDTIFYAVTNMCGTRAAAKAITINPVPSAGIITGTDSLCIGNAVALAESDTGGTWSSSNSNATVSPAGVITGVTAGLDTIVYTVNNAWCSAQAEMTVKVIPLTECISLAVEHPNLNAKDEWQVWPNPTSGEIMVNSNHAGSLTVLNMQGQTLTKFSIVSGNNNLQLPAQLADGAYLLEFSSEEGVVKKVKLIVVK